MRYNCGLTAKKENVLNPLWWFVELFFSVCCLILWLVVRDGAPVIYALTSVVFLGLVLRLCGVGKRRM
jgi:hypothetical protein